MQKITGLNPNPEFLVAHATQDPNHMNYLGQDLNLAANERDATAYERLAGNLGDAHTLSRLYLGMRVPTRPEEPDAWDTDQKVRNAYNDLNRFLNHQSRQSTRGNQPGLMSYSGNPGYGNPQPATQEEKPIYLAFASRQNNTVDRLPAMETIEDLSVGLAPVQDQCFASVEIRQFHLLVKLYMMAANRRN
ncbi:MAG: hypothetical protein H7833_03525, partial [Magnetococcus sp. DMHC-1]